jgi:hypothetical protein
MDTKPAQLEPNRRHLEVFIDAMFRRATRGIVSVRAFRDNGSNEVFRFSSSPVNKRDHLLNVAEDDARRAAQAPFPVVFCPPPCTFKNEHRAKEEDVAEGLVITAELDRQPGQAREKLIEILGVPTLEVKSGGRWKNDSGKIEDKLHLHWRLAQPAIGADNLAKLKRARSLVSRLVGGDTSCDPVCHPVRWPGSWHRKAEPRLCQIVVQNAEVELKLNTALEALIAAATAAGISEKRKTLNSQSPAEASSEWAQLFGRIIKGRDLHVATRDLAARLVMLTENDGAVTNIIRGVLECTGAEQDQRYSARYGKIPELVRSARQKFGETPEEKVQRILNAAAAGQDGERAIRDLIIDREISDVAGERALKALSIIKQKLEHIK